MHRIDLSEGAVLEKGCVYVVPLMESLALKSRVSGIANPKSSIGRLDVFTRLITDHSAVFDQVAAGYNGPLYAEISPRTFSVVVRAADVREPASSAARQPARDRHGDAPAARAVRLVAARRAGGQARHRRGDRRAPSTWARGRRPVGWRARRHTDLIDLDLVDHYDPHEFWEPVLRTAGGSVVLNPGDFYILASKEAVTVPPDHAAEMRPYDTRVGEFRVHYAGFFDPGFGFAGGRRQGLAGGAGESAPSRCRSRCATASWSAASSTSD